MLLIAAFGIVTASAIRPFEVKQGGQELSGLFVGSIAFG